LEKKEFSRISRGGGGEGLAPRRKEKGKVFPSSPPK